MLAGPKPVRLQLASLSTNQVTCTAQVRSVGFMHATHEQVFGLASMVDFGHTTRHARSRKSETS